MKELTVVLLVLAGLSAVASAVSIRQKIIVHINISLQLCGIYI